jgi:RNA polymerase sigma-70 factor, ECF subfamily
MILLAATLHWGDSDPRPEPYGMSSTDAAASVPSGSIASFDDARLVEALRNRDESAFLALIERYQGSLLRLAMLYVPNREAAADVVQETWLGVLQGIDRFEARSSLKTWLFRILTNRAKSRGEREARTIPFSTAWQSEAEDAEPAVDPGRFLPPGHQFAGHWAANPSRWDEMPEERFVFVETRDRIERAITTLPPTQREVITLRDVEGWSSDEVCNALSISETNQRVLLHRARSKVRLALEEYLKEPNDTP